MAGCNSAPTTAAVTIATLGRLADARAAIEMASDGYAVRHHGELASLLGTLRRGEAALVLLEATDRDGGSMARAVATIRREFPTTPVLVYCALAPGSSPAILDVVRAGASGLLFRGIDDVRDALRAAFRSARHALVSQRIADAVADRLPTGIRPLLRYALSNTGEGASVDDAAEAIGVDRKTLRNRLRPANIGPAEFINWIRLGLVIGALRDGTGTVERAALDSGFASGTSFRNMLRRYTELTAAAFRHDGGFDAFLELLRTRLSSPAPLLALVRENGSGTPATDHPNERWA